jgi:glutaredoxin-like protein NrdH
MEQPHVKLYALSTCGHCRHTKQFFGENGIDYECIEVDLTSGTERESVIEEVRALNPMLSFPTMIIGDTVIVGFKEDEIKKALGL